MSWLQLACGELFDFAAPSAEDISIEAIAHSLALQCRFSGHCQRFVSVAEHSVLVARRVAELLPGDRSAELCALLHDASEAILCDLPRPLKQMEIVANYRQWETFVQSMLLLKLSGTDRLSSETKEIIKQADNEVLATEKVQNMDTPPREWVALPNPLDIKLLFWTPEQAEIVFLGHYRRLTQ